MSHPTTTIMGNKGRVVIPASVRSRRGWTEGVALVLTEDGDRLYLESADEALARFRASVAKTPSPVDELIAERRNAARAGD